MKKKKKPQTDTELLAEYRFLKEHREREGKSFDLEQELCMAFARRAKAEAEKKVNRKLLWGEIVYYVIQVGILGLVYINWDDLKLVVVLLLVFIWRSMNRKIGLLEFNQMLMTARLHWAHPTAEWDFFHSEHCFDFETGERVRELIRKDASDRPRPQREFQTEPLPGRLPT
jgi:hypothetical protein